MTHTCLRDEELGRAASLSPDDPLSRAVQACARCRSRLAAYRQFVHPQSIPDGARPAEADDRLAAMLDEQILGVAPARAGRGRLFTLRMAWAAAAVALLVWAGHEADIFHRGPGNEILLREEVGGALTGIALSAPARAADGSLKLGWSAVAGADRYVVVLHGEDLREIERIDAGTALELAVPARESALLWRVIALRGSDPIAASEIHTLRAPTAQ